jgi:hypothetical protein
MRLDSMMTTPSGPVTEISGVPIYQAGEKVYVNRPFVDSDGYLGGYHLAVVRMQPTLGDANVRVELWVCFDGDLKPGDAFVRDIGRVRE